MRARPFARRRFKTARPARVDMRLRNPCFFWRLRLFGWYVLFNELSSRATFLWAPWYVARDPGGYQRDGKIPAYERCRPATAARVQHGACAHSHPRRENAA
jgi:hypothetical protein